MAGSASIPMGISQESSHIPTTQEALIGGVWQTTTAKRDKLTELKAELASASTDASSSPPDLDSVATARQKLDLWMVDGLRLIAKQTEETLMPITDSASTSSFTSSAPAQLLQNMVEWVEQKAATSANEQLQLHQVQWDELLQSIHRELEQALATLPPDRCLQPVRDYYDASEDVNKSEIPELKAWVDRQRSAADDNGPRTPLEINFADAALRFRLHTTMAVVSHLQASWKTFTTVTDQDVDRAAVRHEVAAGVTTLPAKKLVEVVDAYLRGNGTDRVDALWNLMDKDDDGLLDQVEMNLVCAAVVGSAQDALRQLLQEALDAATLSAPDVDKNVKQGWRQRRREKNDKALLTKMFKKTLKHHFEDELEMPNRLRCIYAWANKAHQNNKLDSVLVQEEGGGMVTSVVGRKRYVELHPKISVHEFRQVQTIHFPQVDRAGHEFLCGFREDMLMHQGKGRQNQELLRDCSLFFTALCAIDFIILSL